MNKLTYLQRAILKQLSKSNPKILTDFEFPSSSEPPTEKKFHAIAVLLSKGFIKIVGERVVNGDDKLLFAITKSGTDALSPVCKHRFKNGRKTNYCHLRHQRINNPEICENCAFKEFS